MNWGTESGSRRASGVALGLIATILIAAAIVTAGPAASPAAAEELTPTATFALRLADQVPADERMRLIDSYRRTRSRLPYQGRVAQISRAVSAPPVCRDAFPPGAARTICAQMIAKVKSGGKATGKCAAAIVAVVARPMGKTIAFLAKSCGPPAAALAVGAAFAFLNKKCKAITPRFVEFTCDLLF